MIDPESRRKLQTTIRARMAADRLILDELRAEIRSLRSQVRTIQPRTTTSISLVGTDGGNNRLEFDPFLVQIIRVVDSSNNEYCLEAITPTTDIDQLSQKQFRDDGTPATALGGMMAFLGVTHLSRLTPMIRRTRPGEPVSPSWVQVYRELVEWAILFALVQGRDYSVEGGGQTHFGTDTVILFDGLLRSKVFTGDLFARLLAGMNEAIERNRRERGRRIYLAGMAKHSKVLTRYQLAMALESILTVRGPVYLEIPREIEAKAYTWQEYARGSETTTGEANKFVGGKMFFVKFGRDPRDPVWPVDIFESQISDAQAIIGSLLADAINGFPVPFFPLCLQRAHENAALVDFDFGVLQDDVFDAIRLMLQDEGPVLDAFQLQTADPAAARYG